MERLQRLSYRTKQLGITVTAIQGGASVLDPWTSKAKFFGVIGKNPSLQVHRYAMNGLEQLNFFLLQLLRGLSSINTNPEIVKSRHS